MDVYQVMAGLSKSPENYVEEYGRQLELFESLVKLPKQPEKTVRQTLSFLLAHPTIDKRLAAVLISSIRTVRCLKVRRIVVESLFMLRRKELVSTEQLLRNVLEHHPDLKSVLGRTKGVVSEEAAGCVVEYYRKGTEKQRSFCYYLVVYLFTRGCSMLEPEVCGGLFEDGRVGRICRLYFLDQIDFEEEGAKAMELLSTGAERFGRQLLKSLQEGKMEREEKIMKMKIYVMFRKRYGLRGSVVQMAMEMLNPEKEDVKDLMRIVVEGVLEQDVLKVVDVVGDTLCSEFRDDDFVVYGLNMMREIYCKFDSVAGRLRKEEGIEEGSSESFGSGGESDEEGTEESDEKECQAESATVSRMKERMLRYVECFKGSKTRSIFYAYRSVINVMKHKKYSGRSVEFVRRKASKEERVEWMRRGRTERERGGEKKKYCGGKHSKRRRISRMKSKNK